MTMMFRRLLVILVLGTSLTRLHAQAPASLTGFSNKVIRFQTTVNPLGGVLGGALIRITPAGAAPSTNGTALLSGTMFSTANPTNVFYSQLAGDRALMQLQSASSVATRVTNEVFMTFLSPTNGLYTSVFLISNSSLRQTNSIGNFTVIDGTNAVPAVDYVLGGGIFQSSTSPNVLVGANGFALQYQWRLNGTNVPGATVINYTIPNITPEKAGDYTCVVSNEAGAVTSSSVNVAIAQPIVFTLQPEPQTILEGSYLSLTATATGSIANYQWYQSGFAPSGIISTNTTIIVPKVTLSSAGNYALQVNGYNVSTSSQPARVIVRSAGSGATWLGRPFLKVTDDRQMPVPDSGGNVFTNWGNAAYTPLLTFRDGKVHFVAGSSAGVRSLFRWTNGVLSTLVFTNTPNPLGGFFADIFYPTDEGAGVVNFSANSVTNGGMFAYAAGGISNVINANTPAPGQAYPFGGPGSYGRRNAGVAISATLFSSPGSFSIVGTGMYFNEDTNITRLCDNTTDLPGVLTGYGGRPTANSVNFDGTNVVFSTIAGGGPGGVLGGFFKSTPGGTITKLSDRSDPLPENPSNTFTNFGDLDVDGGLIFGVANGTIYAFDGAGSVTNIGFGTALSAAGARMVYYHNGATLFRWSDGVRTTVLPAGAVVDGKATLSILGMDAQGDDVCVLLRFADNSYGIYIVLGTASDSPIITSEPMDFNVVENGNAAFYISAAGTGPLTYQWFNDAGLITGRTNAGLNLNNVQMADVGGYYVIVSNSNGDVTSRVAQLTRSIPSVPLILANPTFSPAVTTFGSDVGLLVTVAGAAPLTYTWFKNGTAIPGNNTNRITLANLSAADRTNYFVVVSNSNGVATSITVPLTILPNITQQPVSVTGVLGGTATFTVEAIGIPPITYQWRRVNTVIPGATNSTLTLANLVAGNFSSYRAVVSSGGSSIFSSVATLTLQANAPDSPLLAAPVVISGQFQFQLPTQTGFTYEVQSKTNLTAGDWTVEQTIPGDGTVKQVTIDAGSAQKTVRVQAR